MIGRLTAGVKRLALNIVVIGMLWKYLGPVPTVLIVVGLLIYKNR